MMQTRPTDLMWSYSVLNTAVLVEHSWREPDFPDLEPPALTMATKG